jgi:peptidoglycan-associated lipoprotein
MSLALRRGGVTVGILLLVTTVACSHVNREELVSDLDQLRQEIGADSDARDAVINERIDGVEARIDDLDRRQTQTEERMEWFAEELEKLHTEFGVTVERLEGAIAFNVPVHFDFDSAALDDEETVVLDRFAHIYGEYLGGGLVTVEGFTDEAGSEAYNQQLGRRRAEEVRSYLTEVAGIEEQQVRAVSYGEDKDRLVAPGQYGPDAGEANRRVVLVIDETSSAVTVPVAGRR